MLTKPLLRGSMLLIVTGCAIESIQDDLSPRPGPDGPSAGAWFDGIGGASSGGRAGRPPTGGGRTLSAGRTGSGGAELSAGGMSQAGTTAASGGPVEGGRAGAASSFGAGAAGEASGGSGSAGEGGHAGSSAPPPLADSLFFSEYVEGTSNNKALEISTTAPADLTGCAVRIHLNGAVQPALTVALTGALAPDAPLVICHRQFADPSRCHLTAALSFNGNDWIRLSCGEQLLDVIGSAGTPPEKQWGTGELRTLDMTLRRTCGVVRGDREENDAFDPAVEWIASGTDVFDGLGTHCAAEPEGPID